MVAADAAATESVSPVIGAASIIDAHGTVSPANRVEWEREREREGRYWLALWATCFCETEHCQHISSVNRHVIIDHQKECEHSATCHRPVIAHQVVSLFRSLSLLSSLVRFVCCETRDASNSTRQGGHTAGNQWTGTAGTTGESFCWQRHIHTYTHSAAGTVAEQYEEKGKQINGNELINYWLLSLNSMHFNLDNQSKTLL